MALGPSLVLAEEVGSAFCPLSLSRRLRLFAPPALPAGDVRQRTLCAISFGNDEVKQLRQL